MTMPLPSTQSWEAVNQLPAIEPMTDEEKVLALSWFRAAKDQLERGVSREDLKLPHIEPDLARKMRALVAIERFSLLSQTKT